MPNEQRISIDQLKDHKVSLIAFALLFMASIVLNNASLTAVPLSVNQIIKGTVALPTIVFAYLLEKMVPSLSAIISVLVIVGGTVLAVPLTESGRGSSSTTHSSGTSSTVTVSYAVGLLLALISMLAVAMKGVLSAYIMKEHKAAALTPSALIFWQSALSFPVLLVIWAAGAMGERDASLQFWREKPAEALGIVVAISTSACVYNLILFYFTRLTSALMVAIAGGIKMVLLIVVPALLDPSLFSVANWVGTAIYFAGLFAYSYFAYQAKMAAKRQALPQKAPPVESTPLKEGSVPEGGPDGGRCGCVVC